MSNNDFLMQMVSDLISLRLERPSHTDTAALGAAFLAGLATGVWKDKDELRGLCKVDVTFVPQKDASAYTEDLAEWSRAVKRSLNWYKYVDV